MNAEERIEGALVDLLAKDSYQNITVTRICDKAGIARKTFYVHYLDKDDVITRIFKKDVYAPFEELLRFLRKHKIGVRPAIEHLYESIYSRRDLYAKLIDIEGPNSFQTIFARNIQDYNYEVLKDDIKDPKLLEYCTYYNATAHAMFLCKWIREGCKIPPAKLSEYYIQSTYILLDQSHIENAAQQRRELELIGA